MPWNKRIFVILGGSAANALQAAALYLALLLCRSAWPQTGYPLRLGARYAALVAMFNLTPIPRSDGDKAIRIMLEAVSGRGKRR